MPFFTKKAVTIEAILATGTPESNLEIVEWVRGSETPAVVGKNVDGNWQLVIATLEGAHIVTPGDWVIKGVAGEFYPCKPDIFKMTYNPAWPDDEQATPKCNLEGLHRNHPVVLAAYAMVKKYPRHQTMNCVVDAVLEEHPDIDENTLQMMWIAINAANN